MGSYGLQGKTLAEKLAANRARTQSVVEPGEVLEEVIEDVLELEIEHVSEQFDEPVIDTDAIVRAAKAMRDVNETRAARPRTCLVVDDSRVIRKVASKIAASLGYNVIEAENGEEALARCKKAMPDLVLTDWQMPVMSGLEFVTELRAVPTAHPPTVVFCTSKGAATDIHEGIAAGADDYVIKPFDEAALAAKLEKLGVR